MVTRSVVRQALGRLGLLLAWSLVAWGALLLLAALGHSLTEGPAAAFTRLVPGRGATIWGWLNPLAAGLALVFGLMAAGALAITKLWRAGASPEQ